jgi:hypothetical protein
VSDNSVRRISYVGTLGPLRPADEGRLRLARKNLREIPAKEIEGDGRYLVDKTSGETLEVITSFFDVVVPKASGAVAFVVRDGLLVPLRPAGWHEAVETREAGEIFRRKATGRDRLPMPIEGIY